MEGGEKFQEEYLLDPARNREREKYNAPKREHTRQQSSSPRQEPKKLTKPETRAQVPAKGSNTRARNQTHNLEGKRLRKGLGVDT